MKTGFVTIEEVIKQVKLIIADDSVRLATGREFNDGHQEPKEFFEAALEAYESAYEAREDAEEERDFRVLLERERVSRDLIGCDPYCWCVLPEFAEYDKAGYKMVTIVWPPSERESGYEEYMVPLSY
jgi:hypothetical protein